jgi:hypothetical protein
MTDRCGGDYDAYYYLMIVKVKESLSEIKHIKCIFSRMKFNIKNQVL